MVQTKVEIANIWEYKVGIDLNIANFCIFVKKILSVSKSSTVLGVVTN